MRPLLLAALALALALGAGCVMVPLYAEPPWELSQPLETRTADGWRIALMRYRAKAETEGLPVLLVHGLSGNGRNFDVDADHSLARWLAARGRDVYVLSLRGAGGSDRADPERGRSCKYSIDTHATQDLAAALARVREVSGAAAVDVIGHSMGGLVTYIYLARGGRGVNAAVALGSPVGFAWGGAFESWLKREGPGIAEGLGCVDTPTLAHAFMPVHGEVRTPVDLLLYNPENVPAPVWRRLVAVGVGGVSGDVLRQFVLWAERGAMLSADGALDYRAALAQVKVPTLVVAGKLDRIAPVPAVKAGFEALGGTKEFFIAGEENGLGHDYGHMDLIIGEAAQREIWPRALRFLDDHRP